MNGKINYNISSREEACRYLGVSVNASEGDIKSAYRELSKKYHPDVNSNPMYKEFYVLVNNAYRFLEDNPYIPVVVQPRQAKVFQTTSSVRQDYAKQKSMQEERKKVKEWEERKKQQEQIDKAEAKKKQQQAKQMSKEEEVLEKIRAIWLAESIRRQIEQDKIEKEAETKRKLYRAFLQQRINEEDEVNSEY